MRIIKKMDQYLLKTYLQLFAGTFFICLFIFLMQFTWRYVNELIGKGLSTEVLGKFFWYASLNLVPMALPLAILLAALISFGNMGEKLELLSMKAAGVSLIRILAPIFVFVIFLSFGSFYFQNKVGPEATKQLHALIYSIKTKSPELEIPEGIFYNEIPGYNLFVERKDRDTGMLYGVMIYHNPSGSNDTQIVLADSGRMQSTADHMHLKLTLYGGERFQNMSQNGGQMLKANIPYMRETFFVEEDLIEFADTFDVMNAENFSGHAATKDLASINHGIDSIQQRLSMMGHDIYRSYCASLLNREIKPGRADSANIVKGVAKVAVLDTLKGRLSQSQRQDVWKMARSSSVQLSNECEFRSLAFNLEETNKNYRLHWVEWHKKFTLSVACLIFFFIGAPLGAIIRKGGLGMPVVVSVLIFIFYYIINISGEKLAKAGTWEITFGIWLSSMVLAPIGAFLTYKANNDSAMFSIEGYILPIKRFIERVKGWRMRKSLAAGMAQEEESQNMMAEEEETLPETLEITEAQDEALRPAETETEETALSPDDSPEDNNNVQEQQDNDNTRQD